jgi:type IV pilus assembly protein PilW
MIAQAIGAFLMIGAVTIFVQGRTTFRVAESVSRLQENARFALDSMESDIRMAHYWGLTPHTYLIQNRAAPSAAPGLGTHTCGNNWNLNLDEAVDGTDDAYGWKCRPFGTAAADSDTLVVRRASRHPATTLTSGTLYVQSSRARLGEVFAGAAVPAGYDATSSATHRLIVNGYYVDRTSSVAGVPSLRRKTLSTGGRVVDEEVLPGVENLQVQLGIDTDGGGAAALPDAPRGMIDRYVDVDDPLLEPSHPELDGGAEVLAVRVWLRVRAEQIENGLDDAAVYAYANHRSGPFADGFRRVLVSKTIYLPNARPAGAETLR